MTAQQGKFCLVVIERWFFPLDLTMAALTFLAVAAAVNVLKLVAGNAGLSKIFVDLAAMAGVAHHVLMRVLEWELRLSVIEFLSLAPFCRRVTAVAFFAELSLVWIVFLMTVEANK